MVISSVHMQRCLRMRREDRYPYNETEWIVDRVVRGLALLLAQRGPGSAAAFALLR